MSLSLPASKTGRNTSGGIQLRSAARTDMRPPENSPNTCSLHLFELPQLHADKCCQIQHTANQVGKAQKSFWKSVKTESSQDPAAI